MASIAKHDQISELLHVHSGVCQMVNLKVRPDSAMLTPKTSKL